MILSQVSHGLRTLNGRLVRQAASLWWNDCSALALRDGYRGWTVPLFSCRSISSADSSKLKSGDLAVTADGLHVMAYLGEGKWIEADPDLHRVVEVGVPTENHWFKTQVVFVRWSWLKEKGSN